MKAILLAAGIGSRLRPLTDTVPKCMLPIGGKPLLDIWLDSLVVAGVDQVLVNVHHLPDVILPHLEARSYPPDVTVAYEPTLLGSAGTLLAHKEWLAVEDCFII